MTEQQIVLETAGLPGFRVTNDSIEIEVQMSLLDFIIRSGKLIYEAWPTSSDVHTDDDYIWHMFNCK